MNPPKNPSGTPAAGDFSESGGNSRMPRNIDELDRGDGGAAPGGAASGAQPGGSAEARPISELSRRIMVAWGKLWAKGLQVFSGTAAKPEHEHAELVGESLLAVARHGSTGLTPAAEARIDLGFSAGLVVVDVLLQRLEQGIKARKEAAKNA